MEDRTYTYHVDRGKFDLLMLQHAHELGATVYDGVKVSRVDFGPEHPDVHFMIGNEGNERQLQDGSGLQRSPDLPR